jgi:phage terminase Nu1 subunit (DNA packaging protein)
MTNPNTPTGSVSAQQLAALLMISTGRVRQLAHDGVIQKSGRDAYPLIAGIRGYLRWLNDDARRSKQVEARARVAEVRAQEIDGRIVEKMRGLISAEDHRNVIASLIRVVRSEVEKVPANLPAYIREQAHLEIERSMAAIVKTAVDAQKAVTLGEDVFRN